MAKLVIWTDSVSDLAVDALHQKLCLGGTLKVLDDSTVINIVVIETELDIYG